VSAQPVRAFRGFQASATPGMLSPLEPPQGEPTGKRQAAGRGGVRIAARKIPLTQSLLMHTCCADMAPVKTPKGTKKTQGAMSARTVCPPIAAIVIALRHQRPPAVHRLNPGAPASRQGHLHPPGGAPPEPRGLRLDCNAQGVIPGYHDP